MQMTRDELIIKLKDIKSKDFELEGNEKAIDYLEPMLAYIGDVSPELRDDLIYSTFVRWIEMKRLFTNEELSMLLDRLLSDDFIFNGIGGSGDDSVLKRSFSILLLNPILCVHEENSFLDKELVLKAKASICRFLDEEVDWRGYDKEKGWMHAIAHTADALFAVIFCEELSDQDLKDVLESVRKLLLKGIDVLATNEDERLASPVFAGYLDEKLLDEDYICQWIASFAEVSDIKDSIVRLNARTNVKNLMRSIYFRIIHEEGYDKVAEAIIELDKKINIYL